MDEWVEPCFGMLLIGFLDLYLGLPHKVLIPVERRFGLQG